MRDALLQRQNLRRPDELLTATTGRTVIIVTHRRELFSTVDRLVELKSKRVVGLE